MRLLAAVATARYHFELRPDLSLSRSLARCAAAYTLIYWRKGKEKCKVAWWDGAAAFPDELSRTLPPPEEGRGSKKTLLFLQFVCYSSNLKQLHSCAAPRGRAKSFATCRPWNFCFFCAADEAAFSIAWNLNYTNMQYDLENLFRAICNLKEFRAPMPWCKLKRLASLTLLCFNFCFASLFLNAIRSPKYITQFTCIF